MLEYQSEYVHIFLKKKLSEIVMTALKFCNNDNLSRPQIATFYLAIKITKVKSHDYDYRYLDFLSRNDDYNSQNKYFTFFISFDLTTLCYFLKKKPNQKKNPTTFNCKGKVLQTNNSSKENTC